MDFDKLMNSKINWFADWVIRLVVINVLVIIISLPIITIIPAFTAGYSTLAKYVDNQKTTLFKGYFIELKKGFWHKTLFNVITVILLVITISNIIYYSNELLSNQIWYMQIGLYCMIALITVIYAVVLHSLPVFHYHPNIKLKTLIKITMYLTGKYYLVTAILVMFSLLPFLLLLQPVLSVIFVFFGVSLTLLFIVLVTRNERIFVKKVVENIV